MVAIAWVVANATHAPWAISLVLGLETLPRACLILFGGAVADGWGLLTSATRTFGARIVLALAFGVVLLLPSHVQLVPLAVVALGFGLVDAVHMPAVEGLRGLITRDPEQQRSLTSRAGAVQQVVEVGAAPAAGALVAVRGGLVGWVCVAGLLVARMALRTIQLELPESQRETGIFRSAWDGWLWARKEPTLLWLLAVLAVSNLMATAVVIAGVPARAEDQGWSSVVFGAVSAGLVVGMAAGAWGAGSKLVPDVLKSLPSCLVLVALSSVFFAMLAIATSAWVVAVAAALGGLVCSFAGRTFMTEVTLMTPPEYQGRIQGLAGASIYCGIPAGYAVWGVLSAFAGIAVAGVAMSVGLLLCTACAGVALRDATASVSS